MMYGIGGIAALIGIYLVYKNWDKITGKNTDDTSTDIDATTTSSSTTKPRFATTGKKLNVGKTATKYNNIQKI